MKPNKVVHLHSKVKYGLGEAEMIYDSDWGGYKCPVCGQHGITDKIMCELGKLIGPEQVKKGE